MGWCVGSLEAVWNRGGRRVEIYGTVCWKSGSCLEQGREEGRDLWDGVLEVLKESGTGKGGG